MDVPGAFRSESSISDTPIRLNSRLFLVLALGFVLGCRLLLYVWMPERSSDFDLLYDGATRLIGGENPYPPGAQGLPHLCRRCCSRSPSRRFR